MKFVIFLFFVINLANLKAQETTNRFEFKPEIIEDYTTILKSINPSLKLLEDYLNSINEKIYNILIIKAVPLDVKLGYLCFSALEAIPLLANLPYLVNYYTELTPNWEHQNLTEKFTYGILLFDHYDNCMFIESYCIFGGIITPLYEDIYNVIFSENYSSDSYMPLTKDMYNYFFTNRDEELEKLIIQKYIIINLILEKKEQDKED